MVILLDINYMWAAKSDWSYEIYDQYDCSPNLPPAPHIAMTSVNSGRTEHHLDALEQKDSLLAQVEVDEVPLLMGHVASEITSDNALPCWIVLLVKFLFYICCNVLPKVEPFQSLCCTIHSILLHLLGHVSTFYYGFAF